MATYAGGRDIFNSGDTDIPPPGTYDPQYDGSDGTYKKYGFLNHGERFRQQPAYDDLDDFDRLPYAPSRSSRSISRTSVGHRYRRSMEGTSGPTTAASAIKAEESRLKKEVEHYQRALHEQQMESAKEARMLGDRVKQSETKVKDLLRERNELRQKVIRGESILRSNEKERALLEERLGKQQQAVGGFSHPKTERALREHADAANSMCAKLKAALEKMRKANEDDKRRLRHTEQRLRRAEQEKQSMEQEAHSLTTKDYPRQLAAIEREMRHREEQFREDVRKLKLAEQEAHDKATRYMNELGEAQVHSTALERELQQARDLERQRSAEDARRLSSFRGQVEENNTRVNDMERRTRQRAEEMERALRAAHGHIDDLKSEVERLEQERDKIQQDLQEKIGQLAQDYNAAKRQFETSVRGADDERARRVIKIQAELERITGANVALESEASKLQGALKKNEMEWDNQRMEMESDLQAAAGDFEALQQEFQTSSDQAKIREDELESQLKSNEDSWQRERTALLEKLDTAHKDAFGLRDALDTADKDAAQANADREADVARLSGELEQVRGELQRQNEGWDADRKEIQKVHADDMNGLREEFSSLEQQMGDDMAVLEQQLAEMEDAVMERDCQVAELENTRDQLDGRCQELESELNETPVGCDEEALQHYTHLLRELGDRRLKEKKEWEQEREELVSDLQRMEYREELLVIQADYMADILELAEDGRAHMVGEAREMYCELQTNTQSMDSLADDMQGLLDIHDSFDYESMMADTERKARRAFAHDMQRLSNAQLTSAEVLAAVQELHNMRIQGQIVEAAEDLSNRHKEEMAELQTLNAELADTNAELLEELRNGVPSSNDAEERALMLEQEAVAHQAQSQRMRQVLDQCEVDMATQVDSINSLRQYVAEVESERAVLAEQANFQINWLKEHHAMAYEDLDRVLNNNGGHANLRQRIRYVETLKQQLIALKKENYEYVRERDRYKHRVAVLKSELDAYKEVSEADAMRVQSRPRVMASRKRSVSHKPIAISETQLHQQQQSMMVED